MEESGLCLLNDGIALPAVPDLSNAKEGYRLLEIDYELVEWIQSLIKENRIVAFYNSRRWIRLRDSELGMDHGTCVLCESRGKFSSSVTVHHVNEVRLRPELALSRFYVDREKKLKRNLISLCKNCHNEVHKRGPYRVKRIPLTPERW